MPHRRAHDKGHSARWAARKFFPGKALALHSRRSLSVQRGEVLEQTQSGGLAFFRMKLDSEKIVAPHARTEFRGVICLGRDPCRVTRSHIIGMHKVEVRAVIHSCEQRRPAAESQLI